jgi:hypothetical protein
MKLDEQLLRELHGFGIKGWTAPLEKSVQNTVDIGLVEKVMANERQRLIVQNTSSSHKWWKRDERSGRFSGRSR